MKVKHIHTSYLSSITDKSVICVGGLMKKKLYLLICLFICVKLIFDKNESGSRAHSLATIL